MKKVYLEKFYLAEAFSSEKAICTKKKNNQKTLFHWLKIYYKKL